MQDKVVPVSRCHSHNMARKGKMQDLKYSTVLVQMPYLVTQPWAQGCPCPRPTDTAHEKKKGGHWYWSSPKGDENEDLLYVSHRFPTDFPYISHIFPMYLVPNGTSNHGIDNPDLTRI